MNRLQGYECRNPQCSQRAARQGRLCSETCKANYKPPDVGGLLSKLQADLERDRYPVETTTISDIYQVASTDRESHCRPILDRRPLDRCPHCGRSAVREVIDLVYPPPGVRRIQLRCISRTSKFRKDPCPITILCEGPANEVVAPERIQSALSELSKVSVKSKIKEGTMKNCEWCGTDFTSKNKSAKYCSMKCSSRSNWDKRQAAKSVTEEKPCHVTEEKPCQETTTGETPRIDSPSVAEPDRQPLHIRACQGLSEDQIADELRESPDDTRHLLELFRALSMDSLLYLLHLEGQRRDIECRMQGLCLPR